MGVFFVLKKRKDEIMALIKCPECDLQVSDKALACPHCGYPLVKEPQVKRATRTARRRRLPNGFGSITELKGKNLRNPFMARVTIGKNSFGQPILKLLKPQSYFPTYNSAYEALIEYNRNPYDLQPDITVMELYEKWTDHYFKTLNSASSTRTITCAWAYCSSIYNMRAKDVRGRHIKGCMEDGTIVIQTGKQKGDLKKASASTKSRIKSTFNLMFDYAVEYEIVDRNYARTFELSNDIIKEKESNKRDHICFSDNEIAILWKNVDSIRFVDWILIQMYMGWRPQELATLKLEEVHLDENYMRAGMKTEAGKQRVVPIHSCIRDLVVKNFNYAKSLNSDFLLNDPDSNRGGMKISYDKYAKRFQKVIEALQLDPMHRPHDPRKTFITMAKKSGVDEYALKKMVGHRIEDITESSYTERDIEWLRSDIEKIRHI